MTTKFAYIKKQVQFRKTHRNYEQLPIGSAIKFRRRELQMTLEEAAEDISSISFLSKVENNLIYPSEKYIEKFKIRLNIPIDYEPTDKDYYRDLELSLNSLFFDKPLDEMIYQRYKNRIDYQAYLISMTYHSLIENYEQVSKDYENIKIYIPNFTPDELVVFITVVTKLCLFSEHYYDAYTLIKLILEESKMVKMIDLIVRKYRILAAFGMDLHGEVEHMFNVFEQDLNHLYAYDLLETIHYQHLIYQSKYLTQTYIKDKISHSYKMSEEKKAYIESLIDYKNLNFAKIIRNAKPYYQHYETWYKLYLIALEKENKKEEIVQVLSKKLYLDSLKRTTTIINNYFHYKYQKNVEVWMSYLKNESLLNAWNTDDKMMMNFVFASASKDLSANHYYKDAYKLLFHLHQSNEAFNKFRSNEE